MTVRTLLRWADFDPLPGRRPTAPPAVKACSICLRILHGAAWIDAESAIRELRTFELPEVLGLEPAVCDECTERIAARRAAARDAAPGRLSPESDQQRPPDLLQASSGTRKVQA